MNKVKNKYNFILLKIKENLKYTKDFEIRKNASLMISIIEMYLANNYTIQKCCALNGTTKKTFHKWIKRFKENNYDIKEFRYRSRRPHTFPNRISPEIELLILKAREETGGSGGRILFHFIKTQYSIYISPATIDRVIKRNGLSKRYKIKKNPHKKRYNASEPLERVQMDTLYAGFSDDNGNPIFLTTFIDDCSRFAYLEVHNEISNWNSALSLKNFINQYGIPKIVQTDNGVEFTNHYISHLNSKRKKESRPSPFESVLQSYNIIHKRIRPYTPQLNGKVERFHRTLLLYILRLDLHGKPLSEIKYQLNKFLKFYNEQRVHSSINYLTPAEVFFKKKFDMAQ
ncbi:MAG: IS481 family transposase [Candidatus Sericytochromatia bacterium]|nr:MAG: IS481 family transposase [Candidatus Sericytochromatia bacterium]GIX42088.1 MAG: IS481 family transposase [Leptospiraceae bacterium]